MGHIYFLLKVLRNESTQRYFIAKSLIFGLFYFVISLIFFDLKTYLSIFEQTYPLGTKLYVSCILFLQSFSILGTRDIVLLLIISILFGVNLELVLRKFKFLKSQKNLHITIGAGIVSLISAGCAACGLSFASVIGVATVVAALPFHGLLLYLLSILILLASLLYNLQTLVRVCKIKPNP